jgi:hypothetical protein
MKRTILGLALAVAMTTFAYAAPSQGVDWNVPGNMGFTTPSDCEVNDSNVVQCVAKNKDIYNTYFAWVDEAKPSPTLTQQHMGEIAGDITQKTARLGDFKKYVDQYIKDGGYKATEPTLGLHKVGNVWAFVADWMYTNEDGDQVAAVLLEIWNDNQINFLYATSLDDDASETTLGNSLDTLHQSK